MIKAKTQSSIMRHINLNTEKDFENSKVLNDEVR